MNETDSIKMTGQNTDIDAAAEALSSDNTPLNVGIWIKAPSSNSGSIYIGKDSNVTTSTGYILEAGDREFFPCKKASDLYVIGSAVNQVATFFGI